MNSKSNFNDKWLKRVDDPQFVKFYLTLLKELILETIVSKDQLYEFLITYSKKVNNREMFWLFTILKSGVAISDFLLNKFGYLESLALALETFIKNNGDPKTTSENMSVVSDNALYKTFTLSLIGARSGK